MKKNIVYLFIFFTVSLQAQNFAWADKFSGTQTEYGYATCTDASGNVYTTGYFIGTADFDPGSGTFNLTSFGSNDIFVCKLDANGNFIWAKQMGSMNSDIGTSIAVDASGNVFTTGNFYGIADFDPGPGTYTLYPVGGTPDIFISKLDPNGNFVWAKSIGGGSLNSDVGKGIAIDVFGNVCSTGWFYGPVDFDPGAGTFNLNSVSNSWDAYISKLDNNGNFVWAKQIGGGGFDRGHGINTDNSGNVIITGYFSGTSDFDPGAGTFNYTSFAGSEDIFVCKLNANGNFVWAQQLGGTGDDQGNSIITDASGNIYSTGYFNSTSDFDPGVTTFTLASSGSRDIFISKLDASGNFLWAGQAGGTTNDEGRSISLDTYNNIYTTGLFGNTSDFDPGSAVQNLISNGSTDVFINKLDQNGNFIWVKQIGSSGADEGYGITSDLAGNIYTTGFFSGNADFNTEGGSFFMAPPGLPDAFLQKLSCLLPSIPASILGNTVMCQGSQQSYSIASVNTATSYVWTLPSSWSGTGTSTLINVNAGNTSGAISVAATNFCGTGPTQTISITVNPSPVITITSSSTLICLGESATLTVGGASTYTWNTATSSNSIIVSPTITTNYTVMGTDGNGCSNSSILTQTVNACIGINELADDHSTFVFYPNPFSNTVNITANQNIDSRMTIHNVLGEEIYKTQLKEEKTKIDLSLLRSGIYFVRVGSVTKKIIKE